MLSQTNRAQLYKIIVRRRVTSGTLALMIDCVRRVSVAKTEHGLGVTLEIGRLERTPEQVTCGYVALVTGMMS